MLASPTTIPEQALANADDEVARARQNVMRQASHAWVITIGISLAMYALPLRTYTPLIAGTLTCVLGFLLSRHMARTPILDRDPMIVVFLGLTVVMYVIAGYIFGPLVVMPIIMIGGVGAFLAQPSRYYAPWLAVVAFVVPFAAMIALELVGWLPRTVFFDDGALVLRSQVLDLGPVSTAIILSVALLTQLLNTYLVAISRNRAQLAASDVVHAQTWHLKQLLPTSNDKRLP